MDWTGFEEALPQAVGIAINPISIVLLVLSPRPRTGGLSFSIRWTPEFAVAAMLGSGLDLLDRP